MYSKADQSTMLYLMNYSLDYLSYLLEEVDIKPSWRLKTVTTRDFIHEYCRFIIPKEGHIETYST